MTEFIVALDATDPRLLRHQLTTQAGVTWFKLGSMAMTSFDWPELVRGFRKAGHGPRIFLDLKLCDVADTVRESIKRFADAGIAAVSTYTAAATRAALSAGTDVEVWQVFVLTDDFGTPGWVDIPGVGIICPGDAALGFRKLGKRIIVPGVRLADGDDFGGHTRGCLTGEIAGVADFAVVGRPIWESSDPVAAAKAYMEALRT